MELKKITFDIISNELKEEPLSAAEIEIIEAQKAKQEIIQEKALVKEAAMSKLTALGLTEAEVTALIGA